MKAASVLCLKFEGEGTGRTGVGKGTPQRWSDLFPHGLLPLFLLSEPWTMGFSKSFKRKFFYNKKTKLSTFDLPADSIAPFQ